MNRRRFLVSALGAGTATLGGPWVPAASAATDEELAYANFGATVELLVEDFYARALRARLVTGTRAVALRRGRVAAARHAQALAGVLAGAGDAAPQREDFAFQWPVATFRSPRTTATTGLAVLNALLGAYQTAAASVSEPSYRVLYASLAASVGQQIGALSWISSGARVEPFPVAVDLETASTALERYLG